MCGCGGILTLATSGGKEVLASSRPSSTSLVMSEGVAVKCGVRWERGG